MREFARNKESLLHTYTQTDKKHKMREKKKNLTSDVLIKPR